MKLLDFKIRLWFVDNWIKTWIISHILDKPTNKELTLQEAFEIAVYLELYSLWLKDEKILNISYKLNSYLKDWNIINFNNKTYNHKSLLDMIINAIESWSEYFLLLSQQDTCTFLKDDELLLILLKEWYIFWDGMSWKIILSVNKILNKIWYDINIKNTRIKKLIKKEFNNIVRQKEYIIKNYNPSSNKVYELIKEPNRTVIVDINNHSVITSIKVIEPVDNKNNNIIEK